MAQLFCSLSRTSGHRQKFHYIWIRRYSQNAPAVSYAFSVTSVDTVCSLNSFIDCTHFSEITHLLRVTVLVLRFIKNSQMRKSIRSKRNYKHNLPVQLSVEEINAAELLWIRFIQSNAFQAEIKFLLSGKPPKPIRIDQFRLKLDENKILKCQGRIGNSSLPLSSNEPIILPSNHHFTRLLILNIHDKVKHSGVNDTLTTLRERFWILKGRQAVKKVLRNCVICRKFSGSPYPSVNSPDLPAIRVLEDPPFTHTGLDFAGPLYVRYGVDSAISEGDTKSYICLFTCASTRAIHLELTLKLDVNSFLLAFQRFVARRGLPATLISDNATTFKSAAKEVKCIVRSQEVNQYLANNRTTWKFIVERAPWWGGFWKRMIRTVKSCLTKSIGKSTLTHDELNTLLVEVEAIVNSWPLTCVEDDQDGTTYPLTPSHLIIIWKKGSQHSQCKSF